MANKAQQTHYKPDMLNEKKVTGGKTIITPSESMGGSGPWAGESKHEEKKGGQNKKTKP